MAIHFVVSAASMNSDLEQMTSLSL